MSNLHAYFALRNLQGFSKALDGTRTQTSTQSSGPTLSSSGGKSWTRTNTLTSSGPHIDVNARDWLGRTILHIACASPEPFGLAYVRLLLEHPNINVNLQDTESRWTALHRSLYAGNIATSQLLMQRPDIDLELRDNEGLTAFELYNSTVDETSPAVSETLFPRDPLKDQCATDLFTWGGNRNAALGHGDSGDKAYPDQVVINSSVDPNSTIEKLSPIQIRAVSMAKLHTTVITTEKPANLRACGFGSGGRLGPGQHTQYSLLPIPQLHHHVVAIALGQDHTLALTSDGEVLSWGLNRFSQLGYVVEQPMPSGSLHTRAREEPVQTVARKVVGPLKKQIVFGIAACKTASACWTRTDVYTWGTNHGQLGYDSIAQPAQVLPRKVTGVQTVTDLAITDSAMACLLETKDVICFRDDARFRVKFPTPELSDFSPYVPPFIVKPPITKITSCEDTFAALSSRGDVFTFVIPSAPTGSVADRVERSVVKPQRVWSLRKSLNPARDVALGCDGEVILCTESGHVFVRSRNTKGSSGGKSLKFHRVPFIHRAVKVCANTTGAFGALRLNYTPKPVFVSGPTLTDDLKMVRPWQIMADVCPSVHVSDVEDPEDGEALGKDVIETSRLCSLLAIEKNAQKSKEGGPSRVYGRLAHGADVIVQAALDLSAHRVILTSRSAVLRDLMEGRDPTFQHSTITIKYHWQGSGHNLPRLVVTGCHSMTVLLLLEYLYSDEVPALWDRRVSVPCGTLFKLLKIDPMHVKTELATIARILNLSALSEALSVSMKRVPSPTISSDMHRLFHEIPTSISATKPDVFLELSDKVIACHSIILRARCPFFKSFFDDEDWTKSRWSPAGTLSVDMKHLRWRAVSFVINWIYDGQDTGMFDHLDSVKSVPEFLEAIFAVIAVASELLLDKLMLICSATILRHVTLTNVVSVLAEATHYNAFPLVESLQDYVACNLEAITEHHFLDNEPQDLLMSLSGFVRSRQAEKSPIMRSDRIVQEALRKFATWLELQDLPRPLIRSRWTTRDSPKLDPITSDQSNTCRRAPVPAMSPLPSPTLRPTLRQSPPRTPKPDHGDDIFLMDDFPLDNIPTLHIGQLQTPPTNPTVPGQAWKAKSTHIINMKVIMAETSTASITSRTPAGSPTTTVGATEVPDTSPSNSPRSFQKPPQRQRRRMDNQTPLVGSELVQPLSSFSPWKILERKAPSGASSISISPRDTESNVPIRVIHPSPSTPREASQSSKAQPSALASVLPAAPKLVPRRSRADAPAWTAISAVDSVASTQAGSSQMSFAAIQQQQAEQTPQSKAKRSLREIQEEERAKQEEEDFLKWWTAEEQRLKAEAESADTKPSNLDSHSPGREWKAGRRGTRSVRDSRGANRL